MCNKCVQVKLSLLYLIHCPKKTKKNLHSLKPSKCGKMKLFSKSSLSSINKHVFDASHFEAGSPKRLYLKKNQFLLTRKARAINYSESKRTFGLGNENGKQNKTKKQFILPKSNSLRINMLFSQRKLEYSEQKRNRKVVFFMAFSMGTFPWEIDLNFRD